METKMKNELIQACIDEAGYDDAWDCLEGFFNEAESPCICSNPGCDADPVYFEQDCQNGYCEDCNQQSVVSLFVLMGVI